MSGLDHTTTGTRPNGRGSVFDRLYIGNGAFTIVGHVRRWYVIFGVLMLVCVASIALRGFNLGIEFEGGTRVQWQATILAGPACRAGGSVSG